MPVSKTEVARGCCYEAQYPNRFEGGERVSTPGILENSRNVAN